MTKVHYGIADQAIAIVCGLSFALTAVTVCTIPFTNSISGSRDFVAYWATGQQLVHRGNPYDAVALSQLERGAGLAPTFAVAFMRNPPWALPLAFPLGFAGLRLASFVWSLTLIGCLLTSVHLLWKLYGNPDNKRHWLGAAFAPAIICLLIGQTSILVLLGYTLFLGLHRSHPYWAGAALWLCALKPHLFIAIGAVLLAWVLVSRSYRVVAGAIVALAFSCIATWLIDSSAWTQYTIMMRDSGIGEELIPCISIVLRRSINPALMALQYIPAVLGCFWALAYYWKRWAKWNWLYDGGIVTLVSIVVAPYSWITDHTLAIPALLYAAFRTRSQILLVILAAASIVIETELLSGVPLYSNMYLWTAPFWLLWYLLARAEAFKEEPQINEAEVRV